MTQNAPDFDIAPTISVMESNPHATESAGSPLFAVVFRGYDRFEVEQHLAEVDAHMQRLIGQRETMSRELDVAQQRLADAAAAEQGAGYPSYRAMGERISQIFTLTEQECAELRSAAQTEVDAAERSASQIVRTAREEATEIIHRANVAADQIDSERRAKLQVVDQEISELRERAEREAIERREELDRDFAIAEETAGRRIAELSRQHDVMTARLRDAIAHVNVASSTPESEGAPEAAEPAAEPSDLVAAETDESTDPVVAAHVAEPTMIEPELPVVEPAADSDD